jgi:hypothetical protein
MTPAQQDRDPSRGRRRAAAINASVDHRQRIGADHRARQAPRQLERLEVAPARALGAGQRDPADRRRWQTHGVALAHERVRAPPPPTAPTSRSDRSPAWPRPRRRTMPPTDRPSSARVDLGPARSSRLVAHVVGQAGQAPDRASARSSSVADTRRPARRACTPSTDRGLVDADRKRQVARPQPRVPEALARRAWGPPSQPVRNQVSLSREPRRGLAGVQRAQRRCSRRAGPCGRRSDRPGDARRRRLRARSNGVTSSLMELLAYWCCDFHSAVRHTVDPLASRVVGELDAALDGGGAVPLGEAVAAEARRGPSRPCSGRRCGSGSARPAGGTPPPRSRS